MKLNTIYKSIITEDIYGRNAIVYHRTEIRNLADKLYTQGWRFGDKQSYGPGLYATYNLKSQEGYLMSAKYGHVIVKFQVTIDNFLILDYDEFIKSPLGRTLDYTKENFIYTQLDYFKLDYNINELTVHIDKARFSSDIANFLFKTVPNLNKKFDGIIFTGMNDIGNIMVCYKPDDLLIPISYKVDDTDEWIAVEKNTNYFKNVFNKRNKI